MPIENAVPADHPLMMAWKAYQRTEEYANTHLWAIVPEHTEGALWAAFEQGFRAASQSQDPTHGQ